MSNKKNSQPDNREPVSPKATDPTVPKYPRPKILLVDMELETELVLQDHGWNVTTGSFGTPYKVAKSDDYLPIVPNGNLPSDFAEQEIVVVELALATCLDGPRGEKFTSIGDKDWWASCNRGIIDPRPKMMVDARVPFGTILSHGGVFIVFADALITQNLVEARGDLSRIPYRVSRDRPLSSYNWSSIPLSEFYLKDRQPLYHDNWPFLPLPYKTLLRIDPAQGREVSLADAKSPLSQLLLEHLQGARYLCTAYLAESTYGKQAANWTTLITNKYGRPIGGSITLGEKRGLILILPQLHDKPSFIAKLLKDVLPDLCPHLFPYVEGTRWVQRTEYELPKVLKLKNRIEQIQEKAKRQVATLEEAIEEERGALSYLHDLIRETDRPLVSAVKKTLEVFGFQSVVDVDEEMKKAGDTGPKREDLQIHDDSPTLLVEVKGISGLPKDDDALQVQKYLVPRMREWDRIDIQGLAIINHQKNLPALDRQNRTPFREDILANAEDQKFGLLTTWDLFRLTRSYLKNGWKHAHIKPLFYQSGHIDPVPTHYEFIGVVEHFWEKAGAVGVRIQAAELKQGDRIAFELPVEFEEQDAESLQVDSQPVDQAGIGTLVGIKTHLTKEQAKKGVRVFRLIEHTASMGEALQ